LLTVHYAHVPEIRQYAVKRLEAQPDEELQYYLLQLVQALRYDQATGHTELASFLIRRASANAVIGNYFYWYIKVAADDANMIEYYQTITKQYLAALGKVLRSHHGRLSEP
jgi:phosphatidylinositol 3-kinase